MYLALRPEIKILPCKNWSDENAAWTMFDQIRGLYYQISNLDRIIIFERCNSSRDRTIQQIKKKHFIDVPLSKIHAVEEFLSSNNLIVLDTKNLETQHKKSLLLQANLLISKCIYFKIPLCNPNSFLTVISRATHIFFQPIFWYIVFSFAVVLLFNFLEEWSVFYNTFTSYNTLTFSFLYLLFLIIVKIFHEFGHAIAAKKLGCDVYEIGVSFIFFWPVMYTDTSDIWRVPNKNKRMIVSISGVAAEFLIAIIGALTWSILDNGIFKSVIYSVVLTSWITSIFINMNPFVKFDGYYFVADYFDFPNLQKRAFNFLEWKLIDIFSEHCIAAPENSSNVGVTLLLYAICTIFVRLFMILGITSVIIFYFPNTLSFGIIFIILTLFFVSSAPLSLFRKKENISKMRKLKLAAVFLILLLCTWFSLSHFYSINSAPSVMRSSEFKNYYIPENAEISKLNKKNLEYTNAGDLLVTLKSDELEFDSKIQTIKHDLNEWLVSTGRMNPEILKSMPIYVSLRKELEELVSINHERISEQSIVASQKGVVTLVDEFQVGDSLKRGSPFAYTYQPENGVVEAYVKENQIDGLSKGMIATFYAESFDHKPLKLRLISISEVPQKYVNNQLVASVFGGELPVRDHSGDLISEFSFFQVNFAIIEPINISSEIRGKVVWDKELMIEQIINNSIDNYILLGGDFFSSLK